MQEADKKCEGRRKKQPMRKNFLRSKLIANKLRKFRSNQNLNLYICMYVCMYACMYTYK